MTTPSPLKHRFLFIALISVISYTALQKGLMCLYPVPEKTALITEVEYKQMIQTNFPRLAPAFMIAGATALVAARFLGDPIFTPALYIVGFLWFFKGYSTMNWGTYDQFMQFLFTLSLLGLVCYWALRKSRTKKQLSNV